MVDVAQKDQELDVGKCRQENQEILKKLETYWKTTNYLAAAQIYLKENFLLLDPLKSEWIWS